MEIKNQYKLSCKNFNRYRNNNYCYKFKKEQSMLRMHADRSPKIRNILLTM